MANISIVELLLQEWQMDSQPAHIRGRVRTVLQELEAEGHLFLRRESRLEVRVIAEERGMALDVWAYFPIHSRRLIVQGLNLRPETRILLLITAPGWTAESIKENRKNLRHHLGHVLLYLRDSKARNDCPDADREWWSCIRTKRRR